MVRRDCAREMRALLFGLVLGDLGTGVVEKGRGEDGRGDGLDVDRERDRRERRGEDPRERTRDAIVVESIGWDAMYRSSGCGFIVDKMISGRNYGVALINRLFTFFLFSDCHQHQLTRCIANLILMLTRADNSTL